MDISLATHAGMELYAITDLHTFVLASRYTACSTVFQKAQSPISRAFG